MTLSCSLLWHHIEAIICQFCHGTTVDYIIYTMSQKSSTSYFAEYFRPWLTGCKNLTATESEIICEHKCVINVLIFNVPK